MLKSTLSLSETCLAFWLFRSSRSLSFGMPKVTESWCSCLTPPATWSTSRMAELLRMRGHAVTLLLPSNVKVSEDIQHMDIKITTYQPNPPPVCRSCTVTILLPLPLPTKWRFILPFSLDSKCWNLFSKLAKSLLQGVYSKVRKH